ncbi:MAG: hypothetical protein H6554_07735 [Chitinophagales bacterium]|nr:hypothetical protein [Chitinophagales bacterium]
MDDYAHKIQKKTIIILDNASIHKAKIVQEKNEAVAAQRYVLTIYSRLFART